MSKTERIWKGLDRAYEAASKDAVSLNVGTARYVIFSDHHKGQRDKADDFLRSEPAYHAALGYYRAAGYTLLVLGDVEELWECRAKKVISAYERTLALEAEFHQLGRYVRFFGNHDDQWEKQASFAKHLGSYFGDLQVREALILRASLGAQHVDVFLAHGHQGTDSSDRFRIISKPFVRYIWRPIQRITGARLTTPATRFDLRDDHNRAMYEWAERRGGVVLIAGHTHKPVFLGDSETDRVRAEIAKLEGQSPPDTDAIAQAHAELAWYESLEHTAGISGAKRCYFNSGCCSFDDGDCTGIEIADGQVRLVRWPDDAGRPRKKVLRSANLSDVLNEVARPPSGG